MTNEKNETSSISQLVRRFGKQGSMTEIVTQNITDTAVSSFSPKPLQYYRNLTDGGSYQISLSQDEACVALKTHDYGVGVLTDNEKQMLHSIIGKLKDQIWP